MAMMFEDVLRRLSTLVGDALDLEELELTPNMTAKNVEGWDSLAQIRIMVAIETEFGIRFETHEVAGLPTVGALAELVLRKAG